MTKYTDDASNFGADGPFFHLIRQGVAGLVDGEDYFDLLSDDVVIEYVISVPGYPRVVEGRQTVIDLYRDYDRYMHVTAADNLRVYRDREQQALILEYQVHGTSAQTGRAYHNRFVSTSPSRIERSPTGATTSTPSPSSTPADGRSRRTSSQSTRSRHRRPCTPGHSSIPPDSLTMLDPDPHPCAHRPTANSGRESRQAGRTRGRSGGRSTSTSRL